jgi:hypothetical protein
MEGACGKILKTDDPNVVIKKVYRRNRPHQRTSSLRAEEQARMQEWARHCCESLHLKQLFVPRAWDAEKHQYKMDKIDVSKPLQETEIKSHPVVADLRAFYVKASTASVFPVDYELYIQPDGRVAMIDFDKFSVLLKDGGAKFPWGDQLTPQQVKDTIHSLLG